MVPIALFIQGNGTEYHLIVRNLKNGRDHIALKVKSVTEAFSSFDLLKSECEKRNDLNVIFVCDSMLPIGS